MLSQKMEKALNDQINAEMYSAYLYLSMSARFSELNFAGFAQWMKVQAAEEMTHAMKLYDFVIERGGRVILTKIDGPETSWESPLAAFEAVYKHEQYVTGRIHDLVDIAIEEKDHASNIFLQWFVTEQVEEEASADEIVQQLKLVGDKGNGLFMLNRELGARTFVMPVAGK
ncbi:MAG: ferritin [Deltaproteobacteria bacterium]|nr:ferritin [Candidatus Anaeroferrophillus wilburensis]MBN2887930.1 ferritin [Deltaproteobacteria bacterium]